MPDWPVNHSVPLRSNTAVLRFVDGRSSGSGKRRTSDVDGSTRTMAFRPPSVIHGAPSGPTMTPCGAELDLVDVAARRVEVAELAGVLRRVPDGAVGGDGDVVRVRSARHVVLLQRASRRGGCEPARRERVLLFLLPSPDEQATANPSTTAAAIAAR